MTDKLLEELYIVSTGLTKTFDANTANYSKIRVTAFALLGSSADVKIVIKMTSSAQSGDLGEIDSFHVKPDGKTFTKVYEIPGPHLKFEVTRDSKEGTATLVLSVFGELSDI